MMREERDARWWASVASHPALSGALYGMDPEEIGKWAESPLVLPLAFEHGGFLICRLDGFGAQREFHTLFTPEGWGRAAHEAAVEAVHHCFALGTLVLSTFEPLDNRRARPPLSFGFERVGVVNSPVGEAAYWILTKDRWEKSPAGRRH